MTEDIVDILINKYIKENFTVCFYCKKLLNGATPEH